MATEPGENQVEYWEGGVEILADLVTHKPDRRNRTMTWAEAYEQADKLPEPERSQRRKLLDEWQKE